MIPFVHVQLKVRHLYMFFSFALGTKPKKTKVRYLDLNRAKHLNYTVKVDWALYEITAVSFYYPQNSFYGILR